MTLVCGIDVGSLRTPAYVAWLDGDEFELETYLPSVERPLPEREGVAAYALDAPQSLPLPGRTRRAADAAAKTPTSVLPSERALVPEMKAYAAFVEAGVTVFHEAHRRGVASIPGLGGEGPPLLETYPRFTIRTLWPDLRIPSKRRDAARYVAELWPRLREQGLRGPVPNRHDEIDALLCALAAEAWLRGEAIEAGEPPLLEPDVIREGVIVAPRGLRREPRPLDVSALAAVQRESYARAGAAILDSLPPERALDEARLADFLGRKSFCVLATATARGRPQARAVGFLVLDGALWFATMGSARLANLRANPAVSVVIDEGEHGEHTMVLAEGDVVIHEDDATRERLTPLWRERHDTDAAWAAAFLELRPARLFSYGP